MKMNIFDIIGVSRAREKTPQVGDAVWWAPKGVGAEVTEVKPDGSFIFQGGPIIKNRNGRQVPRYTVAAAYTTQEQVREFCEEHELEFDEVWKRATHWRPDLKMWVVGHGPTPKPGRDHQIVYPKPVDWSGESTGSFAIKGQE